MKTAGSFLTAVLLMPVQQSTAEHTRAMELLHGGDERRTVLEIPALGPWAMLIVSPAKQESP